MRRRPHPTTNRSTNIPRKNNPRDNESLRPIPVLGDATIRKHLGLNPPPATARRRRPPNELARV